MNLRNKIVSAILCAVVAVAGVFAANNIAQAQTSTSVTVSSMSMEQLQKIIADLKTQIQQMIKQIAYLKPLESCGNGICRFGETAATCASDCQTVGNCIQEGKWGQQNQKCCQGLTANHRPATSSGNIDAQGLFVCHKCGDGICSKNESSDYCAKDCRKCGNGTCNEGETAASCPADCGTPENCTAEGEIKKIKGPACCQGLTSVSNCGDGDTLGCPNDGSSRCTRCGNGACGAGENSHNCPVDCNDCVIGFKTNECCDCPQKISRSLIGTDGWVAYEKGKDYSAFPKKENCANISCSPCNLNLTSCDTKCGNGVCETGETAASCPADCNTTAKKTCSDLCMLKGYTASRCNMWSTGTLNTNPNTSCKAGELNLGWTSDCTPEEMSGAGRACCCETKTPTTISTPEICSKSLGSTTTAAQKEACAKANGQIVCGSQCNYTTSAAADHLLGTSGSITQPEPPGTCSTVTSCYCACGQSGNNGSVQTAIEGTSWVGTIPATDAKN